MKHAPLQQDIATSAKKLKWNKVAPLGIGTTTLKTIELGKELLGNFECIAIIQLILGYP